VQELSQIVAKNNLILWVKEKRDNFKTIKKEINNYTLEHHDYIHNFEKSYDRLAATPLEPEFNQGVGGEHLAKFFTREKLGQLAGKIQKIESFLKDRLKQFINTLMNKWEAHIQENV
jgi:hypothetical protein